MGSRKKKPISVAPLKIIKVDVDEQHPYLAGVTIKVRVDRVVDTLLRLLRQKHIDKRQYQAAERFKAAYETVYGQIGNTMDFDRVRKSAGAPIAPALTHLLAAQILNDARFKVLPTDYRVVEFVCLGGFTIENSAQMIFGMGPNNKARQCHRKACGERLRAGLNDLANLWFPEPVGQGTALRYHRDEDARPDLCVEGVVPQSQAVHATGRQIFRGRAAA